MATELEMIRIVEALSDYLEGNSSVHAIEEIEEDGKNIIIIRYDDNDTSFQSSFDLQNLEWIRSYADVRLVPSGPIQPDLYFPSNDEMQNFLKTNADHAVIIGGHWAINARSSGFGTIGFSARRIRMSSCSNTIDSRDCFISNNHVLALWDGGVVGENVNTEAGTNTATLCCWLPVTGTRCNVDLALANARNAATLRNGQIDGLPNMSGGVVPPSRNLPIQKSGARTGVTNGTALGYATIRVNGRVFRNVYIEDNNFSCAGDSGSAVFDGNMNLVGFHFAGQRTGTCPRNGPGYFIPAQSGIASSSEYNFRMEIW